MKIYGVSEAGEDGFYFYGTKREAIKVCRELGLSGSYSSVTEYPLPAKRDKAWLLAAINGRGWVTEGSKEIWDNDHLADKVNKRMREEY